MVEPNVNEKIVMMDDINEEKSADLPADLSSKLDLLIQRSDSTEKKIDGLNLQIDEIKKSVASVEKNVEQQLAAIEKRTQANENKLVGVEVKFKAIDTSIAECVASNTFISNQYDALFFFFFSEFILKPSSPDDG